MSVLLAQTYTNDIDPTGWWMSEKLDGIRAVWNGRNLVSRNGNVFNTPIWFTEGFLPDIPLDGELWLGRGKFEQTSSIVQTGARDPGWSGMKYVLFDIPEPRGGPVETRWDVLKRFVDHVSKQHIEMLPQSLCPSRAALERLLDLIVEAGGEGIILRRPKSIYERKRSDSMLKVKKYIDDEAVVIAYQESEIATKGKAHLIGSMGALICDWKGKEIKVGTGFDDSDRLSPPKVGDKITFKYLKLTASGVPYAPVFWRFGPRGL